MKKSPIPKSNNNKNKRTKSKIQKTRVERKTSIPW